jgi:hypothetical protein
MWICLSASLHQRYTRRRWTRAQCRRIVGPTGYASAYDIITEAIEYIITYVQQTWNCPVVFYFLVQIPVNRLWGQRTLRIRRFSACRGYPAFNRPAMWFGERSFLNRPLTAVVKGGLARLGPSLDSSRRCPARRRASAHVLSLRPLFRANSRYTLPGCFPNMTAIKHLGSRIPAIACSAILSSLAT